MGDENFIVDCNEEYFQALLDFAIAAMRGRILSDRENDMVRNLFPREILQMTRIGRYRNLN